MKTIETNILSVILIVNLVFSASLHLVRIVGYKKYCGDPHAYWISDILDIEVFLYAAEILFGTVKEVFLKFGL
jgi:hypothetical protein